MTIDDITALPRGNQALLTGLALLAGIGMLLLTASRLRKMTGHRGTLVIANILTVVAAALATMVSASGMWKFFTDILGPSPLRIVFFAYLEIALFASALLARVRLLREPEQGSTGVDGVAVWVLAALTATLSALDAGSFREVCLRLAAPVVAAWMWERALAAERSARLGRTATRIHWTITLERIFVWLRLAEAHGRDVSEVDRARRRARLGRARLDLHLLQNKKTAAWRLRRAHNKVIRQAMQAAEHIGLADFPDAANEREAIQMYMATLYGFVDATAPHAVAHLNAWRSGAAIPRPGGTAVAGSHNDVGDGAEPVRFAPLPVSTMPATEFISHQLNGRGVDDRTSRPGTVPAPPKVDPGEDTTGADERALTHGEHNGSPQDEPVHQRGQAPAAGKPAAPTRHDEPAPDKDDDRDAGPDEDADTSAVAAMRRFWDSETAKGRMPTGAELSRAAGVPPSTGLGRRKRREWAANLPKHLRAAGMSR